jgi:hypothetical protein
MKIPHFNLTNSEHHMPVIWLSLGDQLIIISKENSIRY